MSIEIATVKDTAVKDQKYVVAQGTNGMTYTGRALELCDDGKTLVVMYERDGREFKTDLYIDNLCSLQETTKEEIEKVRQEKKDRRRDRNWR